MVAITITYVGTGAMDNDQRNGGLRAVMSCDSVEKNASLYLDDELNAQDKSAFEKHISRCELCAEMVDDLRLILEAAKTLREQSMPTGVKSRLREFLSQEVGHNPRKHLSIAK